MNFGLEHTIPLEQIDFPLEQIAFPLEQIAFPLEQTLQNTARSVCRQRNSKFYFPSGAKVG